MNAYTKTKRYVGLEGDPPITVEPDPNYPEGFVLLHAEVTSQWYWGDVQFTMPISLAQKVGEALIACSQEVQKK